MAGLRGCDRDCTVYKAENIYYLDLYGKEEFANLWSGSQICLKKELEPFLG